MDDSNQDQVSWVLTSPDGKRIEPMPAIPISKRQETELPRLMIDSQTALQTIEGFGGTFNESGWYLLEQLDCEARDAVLRAFFDPVQGAGYSVCAAPIGHNDYSLSYYSYNETPGDEAMRDFSIARDTGCLIPYIKAAQRYGSFQLASRPDYPPKWMLTGERNLDPKWYRAFARYLSRYVGDYAKAGVEVTHVSLLNEPGVYVEITGDELSTLVRDHVGPAMRADHPRVKLQLCDAASRDRAPRDWGTALADPSAMRFVDGLAYHSYHWEHSPVAPIVEIARRYPEIPLWQTEVMNLYTKPLYGYADGEVWGKIIVDDLTAGASAWLFWNMIVDEEGGPWNTDPFNTGYPQDGVAVVNRQTLDVAFTAKYYYQTHFSRYVRPGSVRLAYSVTQVDHPFPENALYWCRIFPFRTHEGAFGLVCINTNDYPVAAMVEADGRGFPIDLPGHSIATYRWR